jgi:hypothetical protein
LPERKQEKETHQRNPNKQSKRKVQNSSEIGVEMKGDAEGEFVAPPPHRSTSLLKKIGYVGSGLRWRLGYEDRKQSKVIRERERE